MFFKGCRGEVWLGTLRKKFPKFNPQGLKFDLMRNKI